MKKLGLAILILWSVVFWSCDAIDPAEDGNLADYTCEGCHTTKAILSGVIEDLHLEPHEEAEEAPG